MHFGCLLEQELHCSNRCIYLLTSFQQHSSH